jgi:glutathione synthase/RimK-type ligase-like ATP-grasp enzyme
MGIEAWAASPFIEIKREVRLIILDRQVLLTYEKQPVEIDGLKFFNLGKGAAAVGYEVADSEIELAQKAKEALGLRLSAVDIILLADGSWRVLEVNDGIMMENYARQSPENKEVAKQVYATITPSLFS